MEVPIMKLGTILLILGLIIAGIGIYFWQDMDCTPMSGQLGLGGSGGAGRYSAE
jgi:hypothetical protein